MDVRRKKRLYALIRVAICAAALWIVARGVTIDDTIILADGVTVLRGTVRDMGDFVEIAEGDGAVRRLRRSELAHDADGAARIAHGLGSSWRLGSKLILLFALLIDFPVAFLQGQRLKWLLAAQDIRIGFWECVKLSYAGNFLNFAAPLGSTGGDVFKAYFVSLHTEHKTEAVTTIALDRVIGLATLVGVVAVIAALSPASSRLAAFRGYTIPFLGIGLAGIFGFLMLPRRRLEQWLGRWPVLAQLRRIDSATRTLLAHKSVLAASVAITVLLQALSMGSYFTVAVAFGMDADAGNVLEYYAYFAAGAVVQSLPGPPQGLGTVELAYRYLFAPYGSPSQIVCMALFIRIVHLVCALPGAMITLTGSYKPRALHYGANPSTLSGVSPSPKET